MLNRFLALAIFCAAVSMNAQEAFGNPSPPNSRHRAQSFTQSAWLDLRQTARNAKPQTAPDSVESVSLVPVQPRDGSPNRSIFRIPASRNAGMRSMPALPLVLRR